MYDSFYWQRTTLYALLTENSYHCSLGISTLGFGKLVNDWSFGINTLGFGKLVNDWSFDNVTITE